MTPTAARLTIDLDALAANYAVLCQVAGGVEAAPVVKADGYGLGAGLVAARLWREGARRFFVARLSEGVALRKALGPSRPAVIYVLDGYADGAGQTLLEFSLTPVLNSLEQVRTGSEWAASLGNRPPVALQVDTGMNRQGLMPEQITALAGQSDALSAFDLQLFMSHLGSATIPEASRSERQLERFRPLRALFPDVPASFSASAGIFLGADYRFDLVRPGISLFGGGPEERPDPRLRAVATLEAPICDIRQVAAGETVGYGEAIVLDRPTRLAIVGVGYADGYIRKAMGRGMAWFKGALRPVVAVTMDLISIDIGDAPARPGEWVELMGPNAHIDLLAAASDTVAHEWLVRLSARAERHIVGEI
ncbi:MAG: alanine racemase [Alphaproteobacteria bacterium PA2]|nr:MAG: alanine racemase [Alphaproteobacteria bacterium PA2]